MDNAVLSSGSLLIKTKSKSQVVARLGEAKNKHSDVAETHVGAHNTHTHTLGNVCCDNNGTVSQVCRVGMHFPPPFGIRKPANLCNFLYCDFR